MLADNTQHCSIYVVHSETFEWFLTTFAAFWVQSSWCSKTWLYGI